jgi:hypothetical protein
MMRRPTWLAAGVAIGIGGTLWAEQRVRRRVRQLSDRLRPQGLVDQARDRGDAARARVRAAIVAGRVERERREEELWRDLDGEARPHTAPRGRTAAGRHGRSSTPR